MSPERVLVGSRGQRRRSRRHPRIGGALILLDSRAPEGRQKLAGSAAAQRASLTHRHIPPPPGKLILDLGPCAVGSARPVRRQEARHSDTHRRAGGDGFPLEAGPAAGSRARTCCPRLGGQPIANAPSIIAWSHELSIYGQSKAGPVFSFRASSKNFRAAP